MIDAAWRAARKAPVLSVVMVLTLTNSVAFWMLAEAADDVESQHLRATHPEVYRVLSSAPASSLPGAEAWLPNHWSALLLDAQSAEDTRRLTPSQVVATFDAQLPVRAGTLVIEEATVRFTSRPLFELFDRPLLSGRSWPLEADSDASRCEAVIRDVAAKRWFGSLEVLGQPVELDGTRCEIVGVVGKGAGQPYALRFGADDDALFLPWSQARALTASPNLAVPEGGHVNFWVHLTERERQPFVEALPRGFVVMSYAELWSRARLEDPAIKLFRAFALIALASCAFNLMRLLSTRFRVQAKASAIRRALGATRRQIFRAHVLQAVLLGLAAGVLAPPFAALGAWLMNQLMLRRVGDYEISARLWLTGALLSVVTGAFAGLWPAWQAARVPPSPQLRST